MNQIPNRRDMATPKDEGEIPGAMSGGTDHTQFPLSEDAVEEPVSALAPGNVDRTWTRRRSDTEILSQGNRQPERRGSQSPGPHCSAAYEDDLPEWLRLEDRDGGFPHLAPWESGQGYDRRRHQAADSPIPSRE